jgi:hypothetical protein
MYKKTKPNSCLFLCTITPSSLAMKPEKRARAPSSPPQPSLSVSKTQPVPKRVKGLPVAVANSSILSRLQNSGKNIASQLPAAVRDEASEGLVNRKGAAASKVRTFFDAVS